MDYVFLALLLAVAVLVVLNRRHADEKVERVLKEVKRSAGALPELVERVDALEQRVHALDLEPLRHEVAKLRGAVEMLAEQPPLPEPPAAAEPLPRSTEVRRLVERALAARGCAEIRLLHTDDELAVEDLQVRVEALSEGRVLKGVVHVVGPDLREVRLEDSLRQFP